MDPKEGPAAESSACVVKYENLGSNLLRISDGYRTKASRITSPGPVHGVQ